MKIARHFLLMVASGNMNALNNSISELQLRQQTSLIDQQQQKILHWLSPPDPSVNQNSAHKKQQLTTGAWFLNSSEFAKWKANSNSFLWLHGIRKHPIVNDRTEARVTDQVL